MHNVLVERGQETLSQIKGSRSGRDRRKRSHSLSYDSSLTRRCVRHYQHRLGESQEVEDTPHHEGRAQYKKPRIAKKKKRGGRFETPKKEGKRCNHSRKKSSRGNTKRLRDKGRGGPAGKRKMERGGGVRIRTGKNAEKAGEIKKRQRKDKQKNNGGKKKKSRKIGHRLRGEL